MRDTRESGQMLEAALAAGIAAAGGDAVFGGVLPTPGASLLARRLGFDLAAVISASHNPYHDNGIKFFGRDGTKLDDDAEARIEAAVLAASEPARWPSAPGRMRALRGAADDYLRELELRFKDLDLSRQADPARLRERRDLPRRRPRSSGGSAPRSTSSPTSPTAATSTPAAARRTSRASPSACAGGGYDVGFAFDGDGDRVLAVDRNGAVVDGDEIIALAALHLHEHGDLPGPGVAVTVMTNFGFHRR